MFIVDKNVQQNWECSVFTGTSKILDIYTFTENANVRQDLGMWNENVLQEWECVGVHQKMCWIMDQSIWTERCKKGKHIWAKKEERKMDGKEERVFVSQSCAKPRRGWDARGVSSVTLSQTRDCNALFNVSTLPLLHRWWWCTKHPRISPAFFVAELTPSKLASRPNFLWLKLT